MYTVQVLIKNCNSFFLGGGGKPFVLQITFSVYCPSVTMPGFGSLVLGGRVFDGHPY